MQNKKIKLFNIKPEEIIHNNIKLKGYYFSLNEYAMLRNAPYQEINEEYSESHPRKPYRRAIYFKDFKKIFVCSEKPLYTNIDAKIFRNTLMIENPENKTRYNLETNEDNLTGYWINKKEYAQLTSLSVSSITQKTKKGVLEIGQQHKKTEKEDLYFIPTDPDPFEKSDLDSFIIKLELKKQEKLIQELKVFDLSALAKELSTLKSEEIGNLKKIALANLSMEEIEMLRTAAKGYNTLFGQR